MVTFLSGMSSEPARARPGTLNCVPFVGKKRRESGLSYHKRMSFLDCILQCLVKQQRLLQDFTDTNRSELANSTGFRPSMLEAREKMPDKDRHLGCLLCELPC